MDTTKMQTRHTAEVIQKLVDANPARVLEDGNVVMQPMRLSFANIAKPGKNLNDPTKEGKYSANLLGTPGSEKHFKVLADRRLALLREAFPQNPTGAGMKNPIRNQGERVAPSEGGMNAAGKSTPGYVPGCAFIAPTANRRPSLFTGPIVNGVPTLFAGDEEAIQKEFYSGCWVIPVVNCYVSKNTTNPGVFLGLLSLLKVMDDQQFSGSAVDARAAFGGVQIDSGVNPASLF